MVGKIDKEGFLPSSYRKLCPWHVPSNVVNFFTINYDNIKVWESCLEELRGRIENDRWWKNTGKIYKIGRNYNSGPVTTGKI